MDGAVGGWGGVVAAVGGEAGGEGGRGWRWGRGRVRLIARGDGGGALIS